MSFRIFNSWFGLSTFHVSIFSDWLAFGSSSEKISTWKVESPHQSWKLSMATSWTEKYHFMSRPVITIIGFNNKKVLFLSPNSNREVCRVQNGYRYWSYCSILSIVVVQTHQFYIMLLRFISHTRSLFMSINYYI